MVVTGSIFFLTKMTMFRTWWKVFLAENDHALTMIDKKMTMF